MNVSFNGLEDEIQALMVEWEELDDGEELLEAEPVAGGVEDPGVEVGALHAGVQPQCLPGQLPRGQGTGIGQRAEGLTLKYARNVIVSPGYLWLTLISHFSFHSAKSRRRFRSVGWVIHWITWNKVFVIAMLGWFLNESLKSTKIFPWSYFHRPWLASDQDRRLGWVVLCWPAHLEHQREEWS